LTQRRDNHHCGRLLRSFGRRRLGALGGTQDVPADALGFENTEPRVWATSAATCCADYENPFARLRRDHERRRPPERMGCPEPSTRGWSRLGWRVAWLGLRRTDGEVSHGWKRSGWACYWCAVVAAMHDRGVHLLERVAARLRR